jgi:hypothetical protein
MAEAVTNALKEIMDAEAFDVIPGDANAFVDIATDSWTLRFEGTPVTVAWLSIDDEPDDAKQLLAARRAAMPPDIDQALAIANKRLGGELVSALSASHDPLSLDLATTIGGSVLRS